MAATETCPEVEATSLGGVELPRRGWRAVYGLAAVQILILLGMALYMMYVYCPIDSYHTIKSHVLTAGDKATLMQGILHVNIEPGEKPDNLQKTAVLLHEHTEPAEGSSVSDQTAGIPLTVRIVTAEWGSDAKWKIDSGMWHSGYANHADRWEHISVPAAGAHTIHAVDTWGDGWKAGYWEIYTGYVADEGSYANRIATGHVHGYGGVVHFIIDTNQQANLTTASANTTGQQALSTTAQAPASTTQPLQQGECKNYCTQQYCEIYPPDCGGCSLCGGLLPDPVKQCESYCVQELCGMYTNACGACAMCGAPANTTGQQAGATANATGQQALSTTAHACQSWCTWQDCDMTESCGACAMCGGAPASTTQPLRCESYCVSESYCMYQNECGACAMCGAPAHTTGQQAGAPTNATGQQAPTTTTTTTTQAQTTTTTQVHNWAQGNPNVSSEVSNQTAGIPLTVHIVTTIYANEVKWNIDSGMWHSGYTNHEERWEHISVPAAGAHTINAVDSYGDGWHGGYWEIYTGHVVNEGSYYIYNANRIAKGKVYGKGGVVHFNTHTTASAYTANTTGQQAPTTTTHQFLAP